MKNRAFRLRMYAQVMALVGVSVFLSFTIHAADGWSAEPIACGSDIFWISTSGFDLGPGDSTHMVWGGNRLFYSVRSDAGTVEETVDFTPGAGDSASLALTSTGEPFILHHNRFTFELILTWREGGQWEQYVADLGGSAGLYNDVVCDSLGNPHMIFSNSDREDLSYVWRDGSGSWHAEVIDSTTYGQDCRIELFEDQARVVYHDHNNRDMVVAYRGSGGWDTYRLNTPDYDGTYNALAMDRWGNAYIVFNDHTNNQIKYVKFDGSTFGTVYTVANAEVSSVSMDIELGSDDRLYVMYADSATREARIAYGLTNGWSYQDVGTGNDGVFVSMELNSQDTIFCRYYSNDTGYFHGRTGNFGSGGWVTWDITKRSIMGVSPRVRTDPSGHSHAFFSEFPSGETYHVEHDGDHWRWDTRPVHEDIHYSSDFAFYSDGRILAVNIDGATIRGHYFDGMVWQHADVFTFSTEVDQLSVEINSSGGISLFCFSPSTGFGYYLTSSEWNGLYLVESFSDCGGNCDLELDVYEMPHVIYYNTNIHLLRHAWRVGTGSWNSEDVVPNAYTHNKLRFTSDNSMYIARQSGMGSAIRFVYRDGGGAYTSEDITDGVMLQPGFAFAIDGDDRPTLAYKRDTVSQLRVATYDGSTWSFETPYGEHSMGSVSMDYSPELGMTIGAQSRQTTDMIMFTRRTGVFYDLRINNDMFYPMMPFALERHWSNSTTSAVMVDEYIILDVAGMFWFWPSWSDAPDFDTYTIPAESEGDGGVLYFAWPPGVGSFQPIYFWGGLLNSGTSELFQYDFVEWGYSE